MKKIIDNVKKLKNRGLRGVIKKINYHANIRQQKKEYQKWILQNNLTDKNRQQIRQQIEKFTHKPLISIVMPVYEVDEKWLRLCIESVLKQLYENWEFCITDDYSPSPHIKKILEEYQEKDSRFKIIFRSENGHISAASNSALNLATGDFVALLDNDDELSEDALYFVVKEINEFPNADLIYSDEDKINEKNQRYDPTWKPNWDEYLFYSMNYLNHLTVYRTKILQEIGGFRISFEGSQDYDLALRVIEKIPSENIRHIPKILYHWRAIFGSIALDANEKTYAHEVARKALREYFERKNIKVTIEKGFENYHRVKFEVDTNLKIEIIQLPDSTSKSFNLLAQKSVADVLIFVNYDLHSVDNGMFRELIGLAMQNNIGAVGGKILNSDETIDNCGILLNDGIKFINRGLPKNYAGHLEIGQLVQNVDAVCGVIAVQREIFEKMNRFDENKSDFEMDFCQRLRKQNYQILFTPYAEFRKTNS